MAFQYGGLVEQVQTTATAAGTTTLVNTSKQIQVFTGSLSQTVVLPVATTMSVGQKFEIYNESSVAITIQFSDTTPFTDASGTSYAVLPAHQSFIARLQTNGTADGTWSVLGSGIASAGFSIMQPTVTRLLSGSGTYIPPLKASYIVVEMVGGGGGGSGSGSSNTGGPGGNGGTTTFGTSLLTCTGGLAGGVGDAPVSVSGGTATVNSPAIQVLALTGATGNGGNYNNGVQAALNAPGGGSSPFGGAGGGGLGNASAGAAAAANTGSGGGAGGGGNNIAGFTGDSGASGGYLKAIIYNPLSAGYAYSIGAAGTAGAAGTNGTAGGAGGSGVIIITEYYPNTIASGVTVTASMPPTKQIFLSGSGTYITPAGVQYIQIRMVGGGSGGAGSCTNGASGASGAGGATTFGTILTANGGGSAGSGGANSNEGPGAGGTASLSSPAIGVALTGAPGTGTAVNLSSGYSVGGSGGQSPFGGAGNNGPGGSAGVSAIANTGSGGAGGGITGSGGNYTGGGGGAGGYIECVIPNPASSYAYSVGTGGAGGPSSTNGSVGGAGGSGIIEVTEYYISYATGGFTAGGANVPTVQKFLSGSGTYTTPSNVTYIQVEMVGGGGGGAGAGAGGSGGTGGTTTFGTSLLTCTGGIGSTGSSQDGAAGGTATVGSGPLVLAALSGGSGTGDGANATFSGGGTGAPSPFGGAGGGGLNTAGFSAIANTGSGGGGGGSSSTVAAGGGGAGGYIKAIITNPLSSYAYSIGAAGTAGTGSPAGGAGGSGVIIVTEFYANGAVGTATTLTGINPVANGGTGASTAALALANLGIKAGNQAIGSGVSTVSVTFSNSYAYSGATVYAVTATMINTVDSAPEFIPVTITAQTTTGFTATWNAATPSANYILSWQTILVN